MRRSPLFPLVEASSTRLMSSDPFRKRTATHRGPENLLRNASSAPNNKRKNIIATETIAFSFQTMFDRNGNGHRDYFPVAAHKARSLSPRQMTSMSTKGLCRVNRVLGLIWLSREGWTKNVWNMSCNRPGVLTNPFSEVESPETDSVSFGAQWGADVWHLNGLLGCLLLSWRACAFSSLLLPFSNGLWGSSDTLHRCPLLMHPCARSLQHTQQGMKISLVLGNASV